MDAASPAALPGYLVRQPVRTGRRDRGGWRQRDRAWESIDIASLLTSGDFQADANFGIDVGSSTFEYNNTNYAAIADPGPDSPLGLVVLGSGTLVLDGSYNNTYSGGTTIVGATVRIGRVQRLGAAGGSLTVIGGGLNLETYSVAVGMVNLSDAASVTGGSIAAASCSLSGDSTVTLTGASSSLGVVTLENGSTITGNYTADFHTLVADDGLTDDLSEIPAGLEPLVTNGTTVSPERHRRSCGIYGKRRQHGHGRDRRNVILG